MNVVFVVALLCVTNDGIVDRAFEFIIFTSGVLATASELPLEFIMFAIFCAGVIPII